ncbi:MAG: hypothetical protein ACRDJW_15515 [Thermomicrobiales bacterium]
MLDIQIRSPCVPPAMRTATFWKYSWLAPAKYWPVILMLGFCSVNWAMKPSKICCSAPLRALNFSSTVSWWGALAGAAVVPGAAEESDGRAAAASAGTTLASPTPPAPRSSARRESWAGCFRRFTSS